jgi:hypothetical protein
MRLIKRFLATTTGKTIAILVLVLLYLTLTKASNGKLRNATKTQIKSKSEKDSKVQMPAVGDAAGPTLPGDNKPKTPSKAPIIAPVVAPVPAVKPVKENDDKVAIPKPEISEDTNSAIKLNLSENEMELLTSLDENDFERIGNQLRLFKKIHEFVWNRKSSRVDVAAKEAMKHLETIEKLMFSWIKPKYRSTLDLRSSFAGKKDGIVICAGNHHTILGVSTLRMIREVHKSKLPFEVFYVGEGDLLPSNRKRFAAIPDTKLVDITKILNNDIMQLGGWAVKAFALLVSSFKSPMLIDADVVFFQSPDVLFQSDLFMDYGALFFHDRSLYTQGKETLDWFKNLMPSPPSPYSQALRIFNQKTAHEQESGVVMVNKEKNLIGLLATCLLNVGKIRDFSYKRVFGDKETFWLGFETVQVPYIFNPTLPGTAGVSKKDDSGQYKICSRQLVHVDREGVPIWVNGGIAVSKYEKDSPLAELKEYLAEPGEWELHSENVACLKKSEPPVKFSAALNKVVEDNGEILKSERSIGE